ncbi:MAG: hypothetical protein JSR99_13575 [Proteobacteria bacterium]|nr:hypothetical protein [Pseudomonadota bacterium]
MHNIVLDRDNIGRLTVVQASASTMLTDPLEDMHSRARRDILFKPLSSAERQLMRAAKHLDIHQRRVVAHYIITNPNLSDPYWTIPCIIKPDGVAANDSLTENVMREAMHPVDEFHAFKAMADKGMTEVDIAAAYRTTPLVVKQRLRLPPMPRPASRNLKTNATPWRTTRMPTPSMLRPAPRKLTRRSPPSRNRPPSSARRK